MVPTPGKRHVVLVGSMGVGKTTAAEVLAERLGWPVEDNDVDRPSHLASARLAQGEAPPQPHQEAEHLLGVLERATPTVVGAASGVVDSPRCREALRAEAQVVWLRARPATCVQRLQAGGEEAAEEEPGPDLIHTLTALADRRADNYRRVTDLVIQTDDMNPDQVADRILTWLTSRGEVAARRSADTEDGRADGLPGDDDRPTDPDLESLLQEGRPADTPVDAERAVPGREGPVPDEPGTGV